MSQIGTLTTGAGVATLITGQSQCESFLLFGDVDTAFPLRGLTVEVDGKPFININASAPLMGAFAEWQMETVGGAVGFMLKIATGQIKANTDYRFVNDGVTTPNIYAFSDAKNGVPLIASTKTINDGSFEDFGDFSALFITDPANLDRGEVVFADGHSSSMVPQEIDGYFSLSNQADANGRLNAVSVMDNTNEDFKAVRLYATGGALTVLVAKLPDAAFRALRG